MHTPEMPAEKKEAKEFMVYTAREALVRYAPIRQELYKRLRAEDSVRAVTKRLKETKKDAVIISMGGEEGEVSEKEHMSSTSFVGISDMTLDELLTLPSENLSAGTLGEEAKEGGRAQRRSTLVCDSEEEEGLPGSEKEASATDSESEYSNSEEALSSSMHSYEYCMPNPKEGGPEEYLSLQKEKCTQEVEEEFEETRMFNPEGIDKVKTTKPFQWRKE